MKYTLIQRLYELSKTQADKTALVFKKESLTYRELAERVCGIAKILKPMIRQGDRVCFIAVSRPEMAAVYFGIQLAGGVAVFLDKNSNAKTIAVICTQSGAKLLLSDKPLKDVIPVCPVMSLKQLFADAAGVDADEGLMTSFSPEAEDIAELIFTTGTTGVPKGVMLSYRAVINILKNTISGTGLLESDIMLLPLPLNHSFALRVLRASLYLGITIVLQNGFVIAREVLNNIDTFGCSAMACVPASYEMMRSQLGEGLPEVFRTLRLAEFGAGFLTVKQRREIAGMSEKLVIYNTWGSSESGGTIFCNVREALKSEETAAALGRPLEGKVEVRFLDAEGQSVIPSKDEPARMCLSGDMTMSGYWGQEEETLKSLKDGCLLTSDLAHMKDGWVFMHGRADDVINVGGKKVSPVEVENAAVLFEGIRGCACLGVDDTEGIMGQVPVLFYEGSEGISPDELTSFLGERIDKYKIPRHFVRLEEIPRNRMQKTDRRELGRLWEERNNSDICNPVIETIINRRSVRRFTDKEISREHLKMILKAGYNAPNGHNLQSWQFTVLTKESDINRLRDAARQGAKEKEVKFYGWKNPKAVILVSNVTDHYNSCQDCACAAENMMLAAASFSIGSVWLNPLRSLRDAEPVKSVLDDFLVPPDHTVWAAIALGYPAKDGKKPVRRTDVVRFV